MIGHSNAHCAGAGCNVQRNGVKRAQNESQRARPERVGKQLRVTIKMGDRVGVIPTGEQHRHRPVRRPALGGKEALVRCRTECVRAESIDGVGGKGHESACAEDLGSLRDQFGVDLARVVRGQADRLPARCMSTFEKGPGKGVPARAPPATAQIDGV